MHQWGGHDVLAHPQVVLGQLRELVGDQLERLPVRLRLPRRIDRRRERVDERVHVGGVDVVLLVPRGSRQQHIRHQRRTGHAEVQGQQQIKLSLGRLLPPDHVLGTHLTLSLSRGHGMVGSKKVPQEVLIALGCVADQVGPPQRQRPREVLRVVGILDGELQLASLELVDDVGGSLLPRRLSLVGEFERALLELREERHPPHLRGLHIEIGGDLLVEHVIAELLRGEGVGIEGVVTVLVGVDVPVAGLDHLAGRTAPVQRKRHGGPPGDGPGLLLPDVVGPATAIAALATTQLDQHQHGAVDHVGVIPVIGTSPHDDHGAAAGVFGVLRELPGDADHLRGGNVGDGLLPGRGVDALDVVIVLRPVAGQARASHAVLGQHQVEDGGDQPVTHPPHGDPTTDPKRLLGGIGEAGQLDLDTLVAGGVHHRQSRLDVTQNEIPLAHVGIPEPVSKGTVRAGDLTGVLVPDEGFEHGIGLLCQLTADIPRDEVLARPVQPGGVLVEGHQEW